mgnify:CR=1 FL=1
MHALPKKLTPLASHCVCKLTCCKAKRKDAMRAALEQAPSVGSGHRHWPPCSHHGHLHSLTCYSALSSVPPSGGGMAEALAEALASRQAATFIGSIAESLRGNPGLFPALRGTLQQLLAEVRVRSLLLAPELVHRGTRMRAQVVGAMAPVADRRASLAATCRRRRRPSPLRVQTHAARAPWLDEFTLNCTEVRILACLLPAVRRLRLRPHSPTMCCCHTRCNCTVRCFPADCLGRCRRLAWASPPHPGHSDRPQRAGAAGSSGCRRQRWRQRHRRQRRWRRRRRRRRPRGGGGGSPRRARAAALLRRPASVGGQGRPSLPAVQHPPVGGSAEHAAGRHLCHARRQRHLGVGRLTAAALPLAAPPLPPGAWCATLCAALRASLHLLQLHSCWLCSRRCELLAC